VEEEAAAAAAASFVVHSLFWAADDSGVEPPRGGTLLSTTGGRPARAETATPQRSREIELGDMWIGISASRRGRYTLEREA
jgi:hypothetical protein